MPYGIVLRGPERSVKEVAGSLGYADTSNFDREFHRALGVSPGEFKEEMTKFESAFVKVLSQGT